MTEEELEQKANEYEIDCIADIYKDDVCELQYAYSATKLEQAYKDGYKEGQKDFDTTVTKLLKSYGVTFIDTDSIGGLIGFHHLFLDIEKENAELKDFIYENENREKELCILCENLKAQIEIKTKENELIKLKMKNCLNCCYYKTLKPIYESPIYDEDDLPYPCRVCENCDKWELAE